MGKNADDTQAMFRALVGEARVTAPAGFFDLLHLSTNVDADTSSTDKASSTGCAFYNEQVGKIIRPLLDTVDKLREVLEGEVTKLPTIAVIGSQSAGKSSILERISRVELPRGGGMVTRVALVLQPQYKDIEEPEAWIRSSRSSESDKRTIIPIADVATKIIEMTDELAPGHNINIADKIELRIVSKDVPDLTLIDLPGIFYNTDDGEGRAVYDKIKALYLRYIEDEGCVILCVLPGNGYR
jgi:interferon-induced GTP-binding protein Mx